jgi:hypothetical protein
MHTLCFTEKLIIRYFRKSFCTLLTLLLLTLRLIKSPVHSLRLLTLRFFQNLAKCWPNAHLARVFSSFYTQTSICALFSLTLQSFMLSLLSIESKHDSSFTLLAWPLCTPCTRVLERKIIETYRTLHIHSINHEMHTQEYKTHKENKTTLPNYSWICKLGV